MLVIDFETRSKADLKKVGTYEYCADPSTDIICLALKDTASGESWLWFKGSAIPEALKTKLHFAELVVAHNAEFDKGIYECIAVPDYGFPAIPAEKWYCSSAQCRVNALPAGLDDAAWALGLTKRKHASGKHLIKQLSIPNELGYFNEDPALIKEMGTYCMGDVDLTCDVLNGTRLMTLTEHKDWLNNCEINERGVRIDRPLATKALDYAAIEQAEIAKELTKLTNGAITKHTQSIRARDWILNYVCAARAEIEHLMTVYKNDEKKYSLDKSVRHNILEAADAGDITIPDTMYDVLCCLDDGNKSSVAKFRRMTEMASPEDDRVRGAFVFAGASQTLRYASRGLQLHNMRRDCFKPHEAKMLRGMMLAGQTLDCNTSVMDTLSKLLRPSLIPADGCVFISGDWSSIEARVLPWLADTQSADRQLDIFRSGKDVYIETAEAMGMSERQLGKVAVLSLGFAGGVGAFQSMAKNYRVTIPDHEAQVVVDSWRSANPWAVAFWQQLETAASQAMQHPSTWFTAGRVDYIFVPNLIDGTLMCKLPGDFLIQYPRARFEEVETKFGTKMAITCLKASRKPTADAKEWPRATLWHGILAENITQAFAAVLLRQAIGLIDDVVADVHDEIIIEVPESKKESAKKALKNIMENPPEYAEGLPLKVDPVVMYRYGKE
jgi:DNA polymerase